MTIEILGCRCGIGGIAVGDTRITNHKCDGHWNVTASYRVNADEVIRALEDAREDETWAERRAALAAPADGEGEK